MITAYIVISNDGFIATLDGKEDFIPNNLWSDFINVCKQNDAVVIGRKTYEAIQNYDQELIDEFENLDIKRVVASRNESFQPKKGYFKISSPQDVLVLGNNILLCSGSSLNTEFLQNNLIDKVITNVLPINIGDGIKQFEITPKLILESEQKFKDGRILQTFTINKNI